MYVISLSNITIKINFKQITRVVLNFTNVLQYSEGDFILCMTSRYVLPFFPQCRITVRSLSVSQYNPTTLFILRNVDLTIDRSMETMSLKKII